MSRPASPQVHALFDAHTTLRAVIESALEGRVGRVWADDEQQPRVARVDLGCYAILAGEYAAPSARDALASVAAPCEVLVPDEQAWRDLVHDVFGQRVSDRPMRTFSPHSLDARALERMAQSVPDGTAIERMGLAAAGDIDDELVPHALQTFESAEAFVRDGIGFRAVVDGLTAATATSYAISSRRAEVAIATRPAFRNRGLATAVAARMLAHCLEHGLSPEWSAANPVSKRLALRLGYRPGPLCDALYVELEARG